MSTAIREIDLEQPLGTLGGLARYPRCMLLLRSGRRVVGRVFAEVEGDTLDVAAQRRAIDAGFDVRGLREWAADRLGYDPRLTVNWSPPAATVAVCTRERPADLALALDAIGRLDPAPAEVIVVDNAPVTGDTRSVVARFPSVRYVCEPTPGLDVARNRALREARTPIVGFTDDDAQPEPEWLRALIANFSDPRVLCATGLTLPITLESQAQELFEEHYPFARGFERRVFDGQFDNPFAVSQAGAGANMAVRREEVLALGGFDERLDGGMPTRSGGDHEIFVRILLDGRRIAYDPLAVSWHRHRRTVEELVDTVYGYGVGVYAMWTGLVVEHGELAVTRLVWSWFRHLQLPTLLGRGASSQGRRTLIRAELRGCAAGPAAWFEARRMCERRT